MDSDLNMTTVYTDCDCCFEDYDREYNKTVKKTETFRECKIGKVYHNADLSEVDSDLRKEIQSSSLRMQNFEHCRKYSIKLIAFTVTTGRW